MTSEKANPFESAQEEFRRRIKELIALGDKMGLLVSVSVKPKPATKPQSLRDPGEN